VDRENMANDLAIAKENRKGRNNLSNVMSIDECYIIINNHLF
jgi:hypothetical protein